MQPILLEGQLYYDEEKNEYLIITRNRGGVISYSGPGFRGQLDDEVFLDRFQPVDPADLDDGELNMLTAFCSPNTTAKVGFIKE
jgi:hypothetical protein